MHHCWTQIRKVFHKNDSFFYLLNFCEVELPITADTMEQHQTPSSWNRRVRRKNAPGYPTVIKYEFPDFPRNFCDEFDRGTLTVKALWRATYENVCFFSLLFIYQHINLSKTVVFKQKNDNEGWLIPPIRKRWMQPDQEVPQKRQKTEETVKGEQLPKGKTATVTSGVEE